MFAFWRDDVNGQSCYIAKQAVLYASNIAITHQHDLVAVYLNDAMHHVAAAVGPGQHHIANPKLYRLLQDYAFLAADDKGQHTTAVDRERHADSLAYQPDGLLQYLIVADHLSSSFMIVPEQSVAASSSGRRNQK